MTFNRVQVDIENGTIVWKSDQQKALWKTLMQGFNGKKVWIEVYEHEKKMRTAEQNRYYFGAYMKLIAQETGNNVLSLHRYFRDQLLPILFPEKWKDSIKLKSGEMKHFDARPSTTELNKDEFSYYINQIESITEVQAPPVEELV